MATLNLARPKDPRNVGDLPFNEPMRMTLNGEPVIAIRVGRPGHSSLLFIGKSGAVESIAGAPSGTGENTCVFIDYLLESESVTIFGSATERSDQADLTTTDPATILVRPPERGSRDFSSIPDWTPFYVTNVRRGPMFAILARLRESEERLALYFGAVSHSSMHSIPEDRMAYERDVFDHMVAQGELPDRHSNWVPRHPDYHRLAPCASWPMF